MNPKGGGGCLEWALVEAEVPSLAAAEVPSLAAAEVPSLAEAKGAAIHGVAKSRT